MTAKLVLGWLLLAALALHAGAHLSLAVGFARERAYARAALGFLIPPLAAIWGWRAGMRRRVMLWSVTLVLYAIGVAVA